MSPETIRAHAHRALVAIDDILKNLDEPPEWHVDTLSTSLANPHTLDVAIVLHRAIAILEHDKDRDAVAAIIRSLHAAGLLDAPSACRLLKDAGR